MCDVGELANRKVSSRFLRAGIGIVLVSILLCIFGAGLVLAAGPDVSGGVGIQQVNAPVIAPSGGSVPLQSVPQVLDRTGVSPGENTPVQQGIVSGPVMGPVSVPDVSLPGGVSGRQEVMPPVGNVEEKEDISLSVLGTSVVDIIGINALNFPFIINYVTVNSAAGNSGTLKKDDFQIYEDGNLMDLTAFSFSTKETKSKLDLMIVFDDTGSMGDEIKDMQEKVNGLTKSIDDSGIDCRYALISFKDDVAIRQEWTSSQVQIKSAVDELYASGGGDGPEDNLDAIESALGLGFRSDAQRMILDITDQKTHYRGDGSPYSQYTIPETANHLSSGGISFVFVGPSFSGDLNVNNDKRELVRALGGNGLYIDIHSADFSIILEKIQNVITSVYTIGYYTPNLNQDGKKRIVAINVGGESDTGQYYAPESNQPIIVSDINPYAEQQCNTVSYKLSGNNFQSDAIVKLIQDSYSIDITTKTISSTSISGSLTIPCSAPTGLYNVEITNPNGKKGYGYNKFFVKSSSSTSPIINSITPNSAPNTANVVISNLEGSNFFNIKDVSLIRSGYSDLIAPDFLVHSSNKISCVFPIKGAPIGTWSVLVTRTDGYSGILSKGFTITASTSPTITSISPATGVNSASVAITNLAGTGFTSPATVKLTKYGQTAITATNVKVVSATKITCTLPITAKATGDWNVVLTTGGKTVTKANAFKIKAPAPISAPDIEWETILIGNNYDEGKSIALSDNDGYVITGFSDSTNSDYSGNNGGFDIFIRKYSLTGTTLWTKIYGSTGDDAMNAINQVSDGGFILAGDSTSTSGDFTGNKGSYDGCVLKIDSNGNKLWLKLIGGSAGDTARGAIQVNDGTLVVTGFGSSNDGDLPDNLGSNDGFLRKYNGNGNPVWTKLYHNYGDDQFHSLVQSSDGKYIIGGYSNTGLTGNHGGIDFNTFRFDKDGNEQWRIPYGGANNDYLAQIIRSPDGGYVATGQTWSVSGDSGQVIGTHGDWDMWVVKINENGDFVKQVCLGSSGGDGGYGIASTSDGGYIVVGDTRSNNGDVSGQIGTRDMWVVKLSSSLEKQWQKCIGISECESIARAVVECNDGGYLILGQNNKSGTWDIWVVKLKPDHTLAPLVINSITPATGANTGSVTITNLAGTGFKAGASVKLTRSGYADIAATSVAISGSKITCKFPITGKAAGAWNVVVTNKDGHKGTKYSGFKITGAGGVRDNIGVVRGKTWSMDYNGNGYWNSGDKTATLGVGDGKDKPVTGDWNGNGKTNIGVVRGKIWYVDYDGNGYWDSGDKTATFGVGDGKDIPVTGDWNGNEKTKIGVVRGKTWSVDYNGNGYWDSGDKSATFGVGDGKDKPVTGDWSGNGKTNIGVVRGKTWSVDYNGNGYWDSGDKSATFGVGDGKDIPVTGDWNGNGKTKIGVVRGKIWYVDYNGNGYWDAGDKTALFGVGDGKDIPVVGKWSGTGVASIESVEANQVQEPESPIQPPTVTRPESDIPRVEMPVKSSPVVSPMSGGGVVPPQNPLVSGGGVRSTGKPAL
jgi:hypothetical protein